MNHFVLPESHLSDFGLLIEYFSTYFNKVYANTGSKLARHWTVGSDRDDEKQNFIVIALEDFVSNTNYHTKIADGDILVFDAYTEAANSLTDPVVAKLKQYSNKLIIVSNGSWDKSIFTHDLEYDVVDYPYWLMSYGTYLTNPHTPNFFQLSDLHTRKVAPTHTFNCLVGASRPERDYLVSRLVDEDLHKHGIVTYKGNFTLNGKQRLSLVDDMDSLFMFGKDYTEYQSIGLDDPPPHELQILAAGKWEDYATFPLAYGRPWSGREHILPVSIMQSTEFSLVAETSVFNGNFHLTEKTIRNFLLKQPFVIFSSKHFLKYIQSMGFKTFDGIFNECYDEISCAKMRCEAVIEETKRISQYRVVLHKQDEIAEICEHNYNQMTKLQPIISAKLKNAFGHFFINT